MTDLDEYRKARQDAMHKAVRELHRDVNEDPQRRERIERMCSVMLGHYLPELAVEKHAETVREIIANQAAAAFDQFYFFGRGNTDLLDSLISFDCHGADLKTIFSQPRIFCTYHLGSYRLLLYLFYKMGMNCVLMLATHVINDQGDAFDKQYNFVTGENDDWDMAIIDAESSAGLRKSLSFFRKGWSMLFYIDGNSGVGGVGRNDDRMITIPFLNGKLRARKGIAFLSAMFKAPIQPVYCHTELDGSFTFHFTPQIEPDASVERERYVQSATCKLYEILGNYIREHPAMWSEWLDINVFAIGDEGMEETSSSIDTMPSALTFAKSKFELLPFPTADVLIDRRSLRMYPLNEEQARLARSLYGKGTESLRLTEDEYEIARPLVQVGALNPAIAV